MPSKYNIVNLTEVLKRISVDNASLSDTDGNLLLPEEDLDECITDADELVFIHIHKVHTGASCPMDVKWAIKKMAIIYIQNLAITHQIFTGETIDEIIYFDEVIAPKLFPTESKENLIDIALNSDVYW